MVTTLPYLLFQLNGVLVLLVRSRPRGYSHMFVSMSDTNQSMVRPVTVWPSLPKYTAREQASEMAGVSKDAENSAATARATRDFIWTPGLMGGRAAESDAACTDAICLVKLGLADPSASIEH